MTSAKLCILVLLLATIQLSHTYPVRCVQIGDSLLGTVTDCDVSSDPLPFKWTSTVKLKKNVKWAGLDDVSYIYSNANETVTSTCNLGAPLPGTYSRNDNLTISQECTKFEPKLFYGASLAVIFFYTHHDSFDDVLMFNFPIPGYNSEDEKPRILEGQEKLKVWLKLKEMERKKAFQKELSRDIEENALQLK